MKIFFCFLSTFFLFFSLPANAVQWVYSDSGYGTFPLAIQNNTITWSAVGSINQIGALSSETYTAYNQATYGCGGPNNSCYVGVKFGQYRFSGGVLQFNPSGTLPIGTTAGNKCYITSATSIVGWGNGSSIRQYKEFYNTQYAINNSGWIAIDGACNNLTPSSPSISQLSIIVPEISGYIPILVSGATLAGMREASIIYGGDVLVEQLGYASTASFTPISRIIACSEPTYSKTTCTSSSYIFSKNSIGPDIPDVTCNVSVPKEITISDVSTNNFIGKKGSETIYAQCSLATTLSFQMSNNGIVKVGPFNVTTLIDNQSSPKITIPENGKNINITAEIKGNSETVEAGSYENSIVIIMTIS